MHLIQKLCGHMKNDLYKNNNESLSHAIKIKAIVDNSLVILI